MFQAPAPAENSAEFQQIMQILCNSPTQSANHTKFTPFANIIHYVSDLCPSTENPGKLERINQIPLNSPTYPANYANSVHFTVD